MVRIKMPLKLIEGEKHRNSTFMKRRVVIKKKAMELSKLCDIVTLLVCFGPRGQLETWPEDPQGVRRIIDHYRSLRSDDSIKRRYDLATFFEVHLKKLQAELARERSSWLDSARGAFLEELAQSLDAKLAVIEERICNLRLEEESRGMEIESWGQQQQGQLQHMTEDAPTLALDAILDAQPIQSFEGLDFSRVKPEQFGGEDPQYHAAAAATATVWEAPHGLHRSEMPCNLTHSMPNPYMLPMIPDHGFSMDMSYLDDLTISSPFLAMDFATYSTAAGASTSAVVDILNPTTTTFPQSLCHNAPVGYSGGSSSTGIIRNSSVPLPPFDQSVLDAGYMFSLHRLPATNPAVTCNEVYHQKELHGAEFVQGGHTAGTSLGETGSTSIFLDLPPTGCSSSDSVQAFGPGRDDSSKFVPSSSTNPFT